MTEFYDNRILSVNGAGRERLQTVLALAEYDKAIGYWADGKRFVLFAYKHEEMVPFPTDLSLDTCANLVGEWLGSKAEFGPEPDHDGDNERGWHCYTEDWGHVEPFGSSAFVAVEPCWLMQGK